jgi:tetratricopeptide (TPR) repeat protein
LIALLATFLLIAGVRQVWVVQGSKEAYPEIVTLVAALIALVGLMVAFITLLAIVWIRKFEKLLNLPNKLMDVVRAVVESSVYQLPPLSYTQHIPLESLRLFRSLEEIFDSPQFAPRRGESPPRSRLYTESLVRGVMAFCSGLGRNSLQLCIKHFSRARDNATSLREWTEALWRLGIAHRQSKQFNESLEAFDTLEGRSPRDSDSWALARKGRALTIYARYKSEHAFNTSLWVAAGPHPIDNHPLREALQLLEDLWRKGFREPQFVPFYAGLIMCELGQDPVIDRVNLFEYTLTRSVVNDHNLYPPTEDFAVSADFYWSLAICCDLLGQYQPVRRAKYAGRRDEYADAARRLANLVATADEEYTLVYSERFLGEVPVGTFLEKDVGGIQWRS